MNIRNFSIIAHIDAGKSTLADRLLELTNTIEKRKMQKQFLDTMELERERGITIKLQPVRMKYGEYNLNLIDTPGHVDFSYEVSRSLAAVEGTILLVDATQGVQAQTLANLRLAQEQGLTIIPVINKIDLPNAKVKEAEEEIFNLLAVASEEILKISAKTGEGVPEVLESIVKRIPAPSIVDSHPFRALIFDSVFDAYKGVIAFARVFGGSIKAGEKIQLFASKVKSEVIEVGYFLPKLQKNAALSDGEIGYIATGIKHPDKVKVGDTIILGTGDVRHPSDRQERQATSPLPGYREPQPVVFASFFPEDSDQFDEFKDALERLKLTDASLSFELESSPALGRGFRLGFLGLLHIEIISERLRREFDLNLIISSPTVEYHIESKGKEIKIRSAAQLPEPNEIEKISEPIVSLMIITPLVYMGQIMKLTGETRSKYKQTEYLSRELARLTYEAPLSEIITDFYDRLKSVSSGYASMGYEPIGYTEANLIKLDILVAGDKVEPFSKIVPHDQAEKIGRAMVEKLKDVIPQQLFAVALQAVVGGRVMARETIKARRKDVTGYLYGGDITRKMKLLEKQKKGKKKMKEVGRVNIPQKVFLEMLKR